MRLVLERTNRRRLLLPVPFVAWEVLAALLAVLPSPPVSRDQIMLMKRDNVVAAGALALPDLGIAPTAVEAIVPTYLGQRRGH